MRSAPAAGSSRRILTLLLGFAWLSAGPAAAQTPPPLYLVDSQFSPPETRIFLLDPSTGALTLRADLGNAYTPVLGMAVASGTVLYLSGTDTSAENFCQADVACMLIRVVLDPLSTTPAEVTVIGPILEDGLVLSGITGMTFRDDGSLYAISQDTDGLYLLDPVTAVATRIGTVDTTLHGGDITFDGSDRLWLWTNSGSGGGLYEVDPVTALATLADSDPFQDMFGMAAVGHTNLLEAAAPADDRLYEIDPAVGLTGVSVLMTLDGSRYDSRRGDLDSPFCADDAACDDGNACTTDTCSPGGCRHPPVADATPCDDGNPCTVADTCEAGICQGGPLLDQDGDGFPAASCGGTDCDDTNAATYPGAPEINDGLDNQCPGDPGYGVIDEISGSSGFADPGDTSLFCWPAQAGATLYEAVRSGDPAFAGACAAASSADLCWADAADPPAGTALFYLVRPLAPHPGSWGQDSSGAERLAVCPGGTGM